MTPPGRDRTVDALRALAILGVVAGHWLVTALVVTGDGRLRVASPLASVPAFVPVSWLLQTLAVFFLVGGYSAARGRRQGTPYLPWARRRLTRLLRPVPALLLGWTLLTTVLWAAGFTSGELRPLVKLVLSPLWFLLVFGALTALAPLVVALWHRLGLAGVLLPLGVTALVDVCRFGPGTADGDPWGFGGPAWLGWANVLAGWLVPYYLGVAWAGGALASRRAAAALLAGGTAATAALVLWAGYPASMVGVPGEPVSNLNPPTLAAMTFGAAQVGLALLARDRLARWTRRPRVWAGVALANMSAMTVFLWHQTAMMAVALIALPCGVLPGLHTAPDGAGWAAARLLWLPAFATALAALWFAFRRLEHGRSR
ncbi:acyltransferase [Actinomadura craniellae]|uniref:Acyltransferase n=2 Tax=Actinomadura craniellae TaxID=2231787 RepID=A0A365HA91_9ACTN|nr:acyltransferase [Actinomadura craniellae]